MALNNSLNEPVDPKDEILEKAQDVEKIINKLNTELLDELIKSANRDALASAEQSEQKYDKEIIKTEDQIKKTIQYMNEILIELDEREKREKNEIDSLLVWAIVGMVAVLYMLYLTTRIFNHQVQKVIFEQRTLVEIVGMAFLLLTIIILGTGEKIDRSVLGTLLGTIAGYIFGTQLRPRASKNQAKSVESAMPRSSIAENLRSAASSASTQGVTTTASNNDGQSATQHKTSV